VKEKLQEKAAEKAAETLMNDGKGNKGKVDLSKGTLTITNAKGETLNVTAGGGAKVPDTWPKDVPVFKDGKVTFVMQADKGATISLETSEAPDKVFEYYEKTMPAQGWKVSIRSQTEQLSMLMMSKEPKRTATVTVSRREEGKTMVNLTASSER